MDCSETSANVKACEPCKEEKVSKTADGMCKQCDEYMCCICFKNHLTARLCRKHEFMDSQGIQIDLRKAAESVNWDECGKHENEIIKYYCQNHDDVACGECMLIGEHKGCSPILIKCLVDNVQNSEDFKALSDRLDNIEIKTSSTTDLILLETENNSKMKEDTNADVKRFINDIRDIIDSKETSLLSQVDELYQQNQETLNNMTEIIKSTETKIVNIKREINQLRCSENELFIKSVKCRRLLADIENNFAESFKDTNIRKFEFRKSDILFNQLVSTYTFGTITHIAKRIGVYQDYGSNVVTEEMLYTLLEKERVSAIECTNTKSNGVDTVICLDTSFSMAGQPLTTAIECIEKILDGFETNAVYNDLEENVALVTFGNENKIRHHLTNNYDLIRQGLGDINAGGPSPLWLGLSLSLAEIKENGCACVMEPMSVLPRIILITDGYASRKNILNGDDNGFVDDQVVNEIQSLMDTCRSCTSYLECIKPGECHEEILEMTTNGRMYMANNIDSITEFFQKCENANTLIKQVKSDAIDNAEIDEAVEHSKLSSIGKEDLRRMVLEYLTSSDHGRAKEELNESANDDSTSHKKT
ncbi:uncharacterized protein LOC132730641 isoform X2 [Ruditapes philippinarum]|uniref:uncharacterized protein LOC132730641 isoform X2 n=1 Tax=Ruditapes philippinarum TaxID=129788 RepID=UPI00295AADB0|nr:uncharacterized protein LOC132730641 isoform X2 [Ruditapes philippinarum]